VRLNGADDALWDLNITADQRSGEYARLFRCPVSYGADADRFIFTVADLEDSLSGSIPEIADAADRIVERFIATFDKSAVVTEIREMPIQMLPSGRSNQEYVADCLFRSKGTLQRRKNPVVNGCSGPLGRSCGAAQSGRNRFLCLAVHRFDDKS